VFNYIFNFNRRGFSGSNNNPNNNNNTTNQVNETNKITNGINNNQNNHHNNNNNNNHHHNTIGSATKKSLKLIEKSSGTGTSANFQVLRFNPNNEFGTLVSVIDVNPNITKTRTTSFNTNNNRNNKIENNNNNFSEMIQLNATILNTNSMYKEQKTLNTNLNSIINIQSQITINNNNNNNQIINRNNNPFWNDESNSGWTGTGVMSDRSSVYSIDDGDFDREASRKVNNQLREIESILYEQSPLNQLINSKSTNSTSPFSNSNYNNSNNNNNSSNQNECNEWLEKFPHIRILGKQILKDFDNNNNNNNNNNEILALKSSLQNLTNLSNFKNVNSNNLLNNLSNLTNNNNDNKILSSSLLSSSSSSSSTNDDDNDTVINDQPALPIQHEEQTLTGKYFRRRENSELNNQLLNVFGTGMLIRNINDLKQQNDINNESIDYSAFEEEIFEQEGIYEELLAYDNQEEEYLFEHNKRLNLNKRRRHGLPPITPKAAMKDLVANILFDHMWSQLIDWSADTIKTYARTIAENFRIYSDNNDISTCKSPHPSISSQQQQLDSISPTNNTIILNDNLNNSNEDLITHTNTKSTGSNISPSYSSLIHNNTYVTNESTTNTPTINNNNNNVTKANIIQLKLFDSNIYPFQSYTPTNQLMTRDNSNLNSNNNNNNYSNNKNETYLSQNDTLGDLMTKDLLQIKQLNRNGSSSTTANNNILNKNLNTLNLLSTTISAATAAAAAAANSSAQSRVNSGNSRRQLQINYYRKRYSPIEMGINSISSGLMPVDKNIIIHGAGLSKLSSLNESNNNTNNNRSANNSSQAYNNNNTSNNNHNNDENYETIEYNNNNNENNLYDNNNNNQMDEINLISQNNAKLLSTNNNVIHTSHLNYFGFNNSNNNSHLNNANFQPLPPIENSLTLKPLRISSANINNNSNLKQIKERKERPMTSTATRVIYIYIYTF
jgi:hypothetical protein